MTPTPTPRHTKRQSLSIVSRPLRERAEALAHLDQLRFARASRRCQTPHTTKREKNERPLQAYGKLGVCRLSIIG